LAAINRFPLTVFAMRKLQGQIPKTHTKTLKPMQNVSQNKFHVTNFSVKLTL